MACGERRNQYDQSCNDHNKQEQDQDGIRSRSISSGFLNDYPSHHQSGHVQTSRNNGGALLVESSIDRQFDYKETNHNREGMSTPIKLILTISEPLIKQIEFALNQEIQQSNHQEALSQPKTKASNLSAFFLRIGSWNWESKNIGDLVVKFYFGKKKLVWEFLCGDLKKKMEIKWTDVSAINNFVDESKNERLEIELNEAPQFYKECNFQRGRHTQWETTNDFTQGQAQLCRRHTILFSPGILEDPLKKLLRYDNRLYNLTRQPFPIHNSHFFNSNFEFSHGVYGSSSVPNSNHHVQNDLVQPITSFAGHSGFNISVPMPGLLTFPNSNESALINQIQEISPLLLPITWQDNDEIFKELEPIIPDEQLKLHHVDSNCKPFEQNNDDQINSINPNSSNWMSDMMNHMAYMDDDVCSFAEQQFKDVFAVDETFSSSWLSSQLDMHGCSDLTLNDSNYNVDDSSRNAQEQHVLPSHQQQKTINPKS